MRYVVNPNQSSQQALPQVMSVVAGGAPRTVMPQQMPTYSAAPVMTSQRQIMQSYAAPLVSGQMPTNGAAPSKKEEKPKTATRDVLVRSDSMISSQSRIIAGAEEIRQRYQKTRPDGVTDEAKDYLTNVHMIPAERLAGIFKSKIDINHPDCATGPCGLKEEQVRNYQEEFGPNRITPPQKENKCIKLLRLTFCGIFNILLWACVICEVLLLFLDFEEAEHGDKDAAKDADYVTPLILSGVIIMAACLQFYAEERAEASMEALQNMQEQAKVKVLRRDRAGNRQEVLIDPVNLVPGDIVFLKDGGRIPADLRVLQCTDGMEVDNSALTGESIPQPRTADTKKEGSPAEATNLCFFGTTVLQGKGVAMVHSIGDQSFLGKIAQGIKQARTVSTLEQQIEHFVHIIGAVAILVGLASLTANLMSPTKRSMGEIVQNSAAALFAQVPEGLLPTVTISLMVAANIMYERKVQIRKIDAVETLGCVSVFCSDKTGTLTTGEMTVEELVIPNSKNIADGVKVVSRDPKTRQFASSKDLDQVKRCGICCNGGDAKWDEGDDKKKGGAHWSGNASDRAILKGCAALNFEDVADERALVDHCTSIQTDPQNRKLFEIPFNADNKWMLTINGQPGGGECLLTLKGAPDRILEFVKGSEADKACIIKEQNNLMKAAKRVLAIACKTISFQPKFEGTSSTDVNFDMRNLDFVALYGIEDPPKKGVQKAVARAKKAHVKVVMITGDHPETARAIAERIGITEPATGEESEDEKKFLVIKGTQLESMMPAKGEDNFTDNEPKALVDFWKEAVVHTRVFARVSPMHKQVIVQAFQKWGFKGKGDICAMTGDGVNDAPALKQAQVGVAMNERGNDVSKDAADIILVDDNILSVIAGIEQGRLSSENLQKSIMYTLCSKVPQVAPTFAELLGVPSALTVAQVLLIDIGTDIWTAIAYALSPKETGLMGRPPRHPVEEKIVNCNVLIYSYGYVGPIQMCFCWLMFFFVTPGMWDLFTSGRKPVDYSSEDENTDTLGKTVYYWTLVLGQIAAAISTTTKMQSVFGLCGEPYGLPNMVLNLMFVGEVILGIVAIYLPFMQAAFGTAALSWQCMVYPIAALVGICLIEEIRKVVARAMDDTPPEEEDSDEEMDSGDEMEEEESGSDDGASRPLIC